MLMFTMQFLPSRSLPLKQFYLAHCTLHRATASIAIGRWKKHWILKDGPLMPEDSSLLVTDSDWTLGRNARLILRQFYVLQEPTTAKTDKPS
jgi:hypothetical protein